MAPTKPYPVRFDEEMMERLDHIAEVMSERAAGADVSRTTVIRLAVRKGVDAIEAELGIRPKPTKKRR